MELAAILAVLTDSAQPKPTRKSASLCPAGLLLPTDEDDQPFSHWIS